MRLLLFNLATDADDPVLSFTTRWIAALAKRVEFIHVITMRAGRVVLPENIRVYSVGKEKGYSEPRRALEFYRHLLRILQQDHIEVCFSHMMPIFTVLAAPVLKMKGIPVITWFAHPSCTSILKLAHHLSDRMVASIAAAYPYRHDKLGVVGQGIDTELFSSDTIFQPENPPLILTVGRLSPVKDHPTLLEAASLLRQRWNQRFRLVILGGPAGARDVSYVQLLHDRAKKPDLEGVVSFEPPASMVQLPQWYRRCSLHVNMTPTGFGDKVAWEAMACGRICLVANEGFRETLGKHADDLLFRYGDPEDLAQRLQCLIALSNENKEAMGHYLRERVERMHSLTGLSERLLRVFEEVRSLRSRIASSNFQSPLQVVWKVQGKDSYDQRYVINQFASGKSLWRSLMNERVRRLIVQEPILDLGAGAFGTSSYHPLLLGLTNRQVFSLDIRLDKRPTTVGDIEQGLPHMDETFQTCLAFNVFEHVYKFDKVFGEIWRVLRPGGQLCVAVPFLLRVHADPCDYFRYTGHSLKRTLLDNGFTRVSVEPCGWGAVTAALNQVDFIIPKLLRRLALHASVLLDSQITKWSARAYRNANDYPIGYFVIGQK